jgi:hypothetical protein
LPAPLFGNLNFKLATRRHGETPSHHAPPFIPVSAPFFYRFPTVYQPFFTVLPFSMII